MSLLRFIASDERYVHKERETKAAVFRIKVDQTVFHSVRSVYPKNEPRWAAEADDHARFILRKEVIQPQVPLRLPCYDFTPVADLTVACCLLAVSAQSSGKTNSHGVTGGVYKARERIHRGMLIHDY